MATLVQVNTVLLPTVLDVEVGVKPVAGKPLGIVVRTPLVPASTTMAPVGTVSDMTGVVNGRKLTIVALVGVRRTYKFARRVVAL